MTLKEAMQNYKGVGPGFHFLRHVLSITILIHHLRIMTIGAAANFVTPDGHQKGVISAGMSHESMLVEILRPGLYSLVGIFFALSGFLVVGSAVRNNSVKIFFANRALRILPALATEVTLSALILGPIMTTLPLITYFTDPQFFRYFGNILGIVTFTLPGVFKDAPWAPIVNGNLWTLPSEFWCYFVMLVILATGFIKNGRLLTVLAVVAVIGAALLFAYDPVRFTVRADTTHFNNWFIVLMFVMGAAAYINADKIILNPLLFIGSAILYYFSIMLNIIPVLGGVFLTYCMIYLGFCRFPWFDRLVKSDVSYGIYLYGWPLSQVTVMALAPHLQGWGTYPKLAIFAPTVLFIVWTFSALSWQFIEKPALSLRHLFITKPIPPSAIADPLRVAS